MFLEVISIDDFEKYLDDPDISNEPAPLREVHAIRLLIQEETKAMTPEQRVEFYNKAGEEAARKYGFRRVESADE